MFTKESELGYQKVGSSIDSDLGCVFQIFAV